MKPKFRIGDRVRVIETGNLGYVIDLGEDMYPTREIFAVGDTLYAKCGDATPFYFGEELELVGCGIPAPALRWESCGTGMWMAEIFGGNFYVTLDEEDGPFETSEKKRQCEDDWQRLWDKEMLISRDLAKKQE